MGAPLIIALVVLGLITILAIVLATKAVVRRLAASSASTIEAEFDGVPVLRKDPMANFFGLESKGGKQVRGNGALVLTEDEVWFRRIGAGEPLRIPRAAITGTSVVRSHAGKTVGRPLVRVDFDGPGGADSAAWFVADATAWAESLDPS
jgi:hypothetical protein